VPEQVGASGVGNVVGGRSGKLRCGEAFLGEGVTERFGEPAVNGNDLVGQACEGAKLVEIGVVTGKQNPVAISERYDASRLHRVLLVGELR
jgi:hypothetical protein